MIVDGGIRSKYFKSEAVSKSVSQSDSRQTHGHTQIDSQTDTHTDTDRQSDGRTDGRTEIPLILDELTTVMSAFPFFPKAGQYLLTGA